MSRIYQLTYLLLVLFVLSSCSKKNEGVSVVVENQLAVDQIKTIELNISELGLSSNDFANLKVQNIETEENILSQLIDIDMDGVDDVLLFQPNIKANSFVQYFITPTSDSSEVESKVFSRFVPERTDDYAWENDKVAFRTFGPTAQKMKEDGVIAKTNYGTEGGTLSSGLDCWLKKVDYPIINIWYKKHTTGAGSYHKDTGEGLDNFHVGSSRGCGGTGVYMNEVLYASKNFTTYKTLSNGPIRTSFVLDYEDWNADSLTIKEQKIISLDLGSNLMHVLVNVEGTDVITVGLTLHENDGEVSIDTLKGWFTYTQPHGDSELATAIVCKPDNLVGYTKVVSEEKDKSQLLVHLRVVEGKTEYYTGFNWKESGQFASQQEWETYLEDFASTKLDYAKLNNEIGRVIIK